MKLKQYSDGLAIWLSSSVFILVMTALVILAATKYGPSGVLAVLVGAEFILQIYKIIYQSIACRKPYDLKLVKRITNCWTIYMILNTTLCTGGLFAYLLLFAENNTCGIPKCVYFVIILAVACLLSLIPIQRFLNPKKYAGKKWYPAKLISSFVPRFVILYTFVVYYILAYASNTSSSHIIPALCVAYIGIERLISMFQTVATYSKLEYYSMFRDTAKWIREKRHLD